MQRELQECLLTRGSDSGYYNNWAKEPCPQRDSDTHILPGQCEACLQGITARFSHLPATVLCTPEEDLKVQELRNAEMRATELKERSAVLNANEEALLALKLAHYAESDHTANMSLVAPSGDVVEAADAVFELLDAVSDATNGPIVSYEALVKAAQEARNAAEGAVEEIKRLRVELEQLPGVVRYCKCCTFCRWKAERARIVPSDHAQQLNVLAAGGPRLVASEPGRTPFEVCRRPLPPIHCFPRSSPISSTSYAFTSGPVSDLPLPSLRELADGD